LIRQIPIGGFDNNFSYFLHEEGEKGIAIVDPGDIPHLEAEISQDMLVPKMVLLTHTHFDHVSGVNEIVEKYGIPVFMHSAGRGRLEVSDEMCVFLEDNEVVDLGKIKIKVLYTPGHIDDSVCYFIDAKNADDSKPKLVSGDTLFVEGCGRADLEFSDVRALYESLQRLKTLPDETKVYPGHDYGSKPVSDIVWEKKHNKYMLCKSFEEFRKVRMGH
jgi:hydroxyacylglutathione hydrolase